MIACGVCGPCKAGRPESCFDPVGYGGLGFTAQSSFKGFSSTSTGKWKDMGEYDSAEKKLYVKCAESHKPLVLHSPLKVTEEIVLYGGAAASPTKKDCDIYVSLDWGTSSKEVKSYPWNEGPQFIYFPITDMSAPKDVVEFKKMVEWLKVQALAGKSIHVGCIGGHGRTGMLLAALVKEIAGIEDAIKHVRDNYCNKAVESSEQVEFLHKQFGITKRDGHKSYSDTGENKGFTKADKKFDGTGVGATIGGQVEKFNERYKRDQSDILVPVKPVSKRGNVWGIKA